MFHTIKSVQPLENYILLITFKDGATKIYDVKILFEEIDAFNDLKNMKGLFEQVKVDVGGYGISWNDEIDLACEELWNNGISHERKES